MSYHPNRLVLESGQRLVVEHFCNVPNMRLALRPARKRLFSEEPEIPTLQVELSKPAFAALIPEDDPEGRPYLVFETDTVSAGIRDLYRNADIPFIEADNSGGRGMFRFERPGFIAKLQFDERGDKQAIESLMRWSETSPRASKGLLIRNEVEQSISRALLELGDEMGVAVHHHIPFGYAAGYRADLPRPIARHTIEMAVSMRPDRHPCAPIVMPIRIDADTNPDPGAAERDECVADFVCSVGMPMAAVQPGDGGRYRVTYSLEGDEDIQLRPDDEKGWSKVMRDITAHAVCAIGPSIDFAQSPVGVS